MPIIRMDEFILGSVEIEDTVFKLFFVLHFGDDVVGHASQLVEIPDVAEGDRGGQEREPADHHHVVPATKVVVSFAIWIRGYSLIYLDCLLALA